MGDLRLWIGVISEQACGRGAQFIWSGAHAVTFLQRRLLDDRSTRTRHLDYRNVVESAFSISWMEVEQRTI
jgi:hypothetical protein